MYCHVFYESQCTSENNDPSLGSPAMHEERMRPVADFPRLQSVLPDHLKDPTQSPGVFRRYLKSYSFALILTAFDAF